MHRCVKTLGLEPNHTGLKAQLLFFFFLEESCKVKRNDTQTSLNFSNYFKRVLKLPKRSSSFSNQQNSDQIKFTTSSSRARNNRDKNKR